MYNVQTIGKYHLILINQSITTYCNNSSQNTCLILQQIYIFVSTKPLLKDWSGGEETGALKGIIGSTVQLSLF